MKNTINEAAERELARLAAAHYELPETDIPALMAFERHKNEQVKILGMPGLSAVPCFIAGFHAGQADRAAQPQAAIQAPAEATEEMYLAACRAYMGWDALCNSEEGRNLPYSQPQFTHRDVYRAMIAAAPTPPAHELENPDPPPLEHDPVADVEIDEKGTADGKQ